jgi:hypothetical protein
MSKEAFKDFFGTRIKVGKIEKPIDFVSVEENIVGENDDFEIEKIRDILGINDEQE